MPANGGRRSQQQLSGRYSPRDENHDSDNEMDNVGDSLHQFRDSGPPQADTSESKLKEEGSVPLADKIHDAALNLVREVRKRRARHRVDFQDQATMSPFAKFRYYGRLPCKFILNVIMFALLTFVIIAFELPASKADESERKLLQSHFINAVIGDSDIEAIMPGGDDIVDEPTVHLFQRSEVLGAIERVVETYYSIASIALTDFDLLFNDVGPAGWAPTNSSNQTTNTTAKKVALTSRKLSTQEQLPHLSSALPTAGVGRKRPTRTVKKASLFERSQVQYLHSREARYLPAPPPALSNVARRAFEVREEPQSRNGHVLRGNAYYNFVRGLFLGGNISDPNSIQNSWMLQPIMEVFFLAVSGRVDWRAETYQLDARSFYLDRSAPLGPFLTDVAALPDGSSDAKADDETSPTGSPLLQIGAGGSESAGNTTRPGWLPFMCAPRPDPFFQGDYFLPCRTPSSVIVDSSDAEDGDNTNTTTRRAFATDALPTQRRRARPKEGARQRKFRMAQQQVRRRSRFVGASATRSFATAESSAAGGPDRPDYNAITPMGLFDQTERVRISLQIHQVCNAITDKSDNVIALFYRDALYFWEIDVLFVTSLNGKVTVTFPVRHDVQRHLPRFHVTFLAIVTIGICAAWDILLRMRAIRRVFRYRTMLRTKMKEHLRLKKEEAQREEEEEHAEAMAAFFQGGGPVEATEIGGGKVSPPLAAQSAPAKVDDLYTPNNLEEGLLNGSGTPQPRKDLWKTVLNAVQRNSKTKSLLLSKTDIGDSRETPQTASSVELKKSMRAMEEAKFHKRWKKSLRADMGMSWHLWSILTDVLCLIYMWYTTAASLEVSATLETGRVLRIVVGFACAGSAVLFSSYLRFFPNLYFMIRATSGAASRLAIFLLGVLPVYLGFAIFFTTVSGDMSSGLYMSVFQSVATLTFAWFGDNLFPDFLALDMASMTHVHVVTYLMLVMFIAFAMYCVLNVTLAIVIDSYTSVRKRYGLTIAPQDWFKHKRLDPKGGGKRVATSKRGMMAMTAKLRRRDDALREVKRNLMVLAATFDSSDEWEDLGSKRTRKVKTKRLLGGEALDPVIAIEGADAEEAAPIDSSSLGTSEFSPEDPARDEDYEEVKEELNEGELGGLLGEPEVDMGLLGHFRRTASRQPQRRRSRSPQDD